MIITLLDPFSAVPVHYTVYPGNPFLDPPDGKKANTDAARLSMKARPISLGQRSDQVKILTAGQGPFQRILSDFPGIGAHLLRQRETCPIQNQPHPTGLGNFPRLMSQPVTHIITAYGASGLQEPASGFHIRKGPAMGLYQAWITFHPKMPIFPQHEMKASGRSPQFSGHEKHIPRAGGGA